MIPGYQLLYADLSKYRFLISRDINYWPNSGQFDSRRIGAILSFFLSHPPWDPCDFTLVFWEKALQADKLPWHAALAALWEAYVTSPLNAPKYQALFGEPSAALLSLPDSPYRKAAPQKRPIILLEARNVLYAVARPQHNGNLFSPLCTSKALKLLSLSFLVLSLPLSVYNITHFLLLVMTCHAFVWQYFHLRVWYHVSYLPTYTPLHLFWTITCFHIW